MKTAEIHRDGEVVRIGHVNVAEREDEKVVEEDAVVTNLVTDREVEVTMGTTVVKVHDLAVGTKEGMTEDTKIAPMTTRTVSDILVMEKATLNIVMAITGTETLKKEIPAAGGTKVSVANHQEAGQKTIDQTM